MANPKKWLIQNIVPSPGRLLPLFAPPRHWHTKSYWVEEVGSIVPLLATFSCLSYFLQVFVSHTAPTRHGPRQTNGWSSQRWRKTLRSEMGHVARKPKAVLYSASALTRKPKICDACPALALWYCLLMDGRNYVQYSTYRRLLQIWIEAQIGIILVLMYETNKMLKCYVLNIYCLL